MAKVSKSKTVEQLRRDLKATDPELYDYIKNLEQAKILDSIGDRLPDHATANYMWAESARHAEQAKSVALKLRPPTNAKSPA